jgi:hypothetical protein
VLRADTFVLLHSPISAKPTCDAERRAEGPAACRTEVENPEVSTADGTSDPSWTIVGVRAP